MDAHGFTFSEGLSLQVAWRRPGVSDTVGQVPTAGWAAPFIPP